VIIGAWWICTSYKYYVSGHYPSSRVYLKTPSCVLQNTETGFCLRLQVKSTQMDSSDRASPYFRGGGGWDWISWYCCHYWPIVPAPDDGWWWLWRNWWNEDWEGKRKQSDKTCPSATLSTTNSTWLVPGLNPGRRGGKPATNRLSYGAAITNILTQKQKNRVPKTKRRFWINFNKLLRASPQMVSPEGERYAYRGLKAKCRFYRPHGFHCCAVFNNQQLSTKQQPISFPRSDLIAYENVRMYNVFCSSTRVP
jgi:hypothetical protein